MKNRCSNAVGEAIPACRQAGADHPLTKGFPNLGAHRGAPLHSLSFLRKQESISFFKNHTWVPVFTGMTTWLNQQENLFKQLKGLSFLRKQSLPRTGCGESRSCSLVLKDSKGISVLFLVIAMLLMVTIGYVFSYLIPTKQRSVVFPIQSNQAFFIAQSGVEFAVRYAKDSGWTTKAALNNLNNAANNARTLGSGRFTLTYASGNDTFTSIGEVPTGTQRRQINVSNFSSFLYYFAYHKSITVNTGQVSGGPYTNFPMLVSLTDPNLQALPNGAANGGHIAAYNGTTNDPQDLVFEALDDTTCGGANTSPCKLAHEIEAYGASNGQLVAWVNVPSITSASPNNTVIYMYYGNSCMTASTQNASGVWAGYNGVWHSEESATPLTDSTGNNNAATNSTQTTGQIGYAQSYTPNQYASKATGVVNIPRNNASQTISVWFTIGLADNGTRSGVCFVNPTSASGVQFGQRNSSVTFWKWGGALLAGAQNNPTAGTFHYMVYTFDGTTHRPYFDGTALTTGATAAQTGAVNQIYFSTYDGTNEPWNGRIDEVRIINTVRSPGWIATEYNNQRAPGTFYTVGAEQNN